MAVSELFVVENLTSYNIGFRANHIATTGTGDTLLVGTKAQIINRYGKLVTEISMPRNGIFWSVAQWKQLLFITDITRPRIYVVHENGTYYKVITSGIANMQGIAVAQNTIWLTHDNHIYKLTVNANFLVLRSEFVKPVIPKSANPANLSSELQHPSGIAVSDSHIVVTYTPYHKVAVFSQTGHLIALFGGYGHEDGQLDSPVDVAVDSSGRIYVADMHNKRISMFSKEGQFLQQLITKETGLKGKPLALAIHSDMLYVIINASEANDSMLYMIQLQ